MLGALLAGINAPPSIVSLVEPIGTLWVNGIRMTVLPLVVSLVIVSIGTSREAGNIGRLGRNAILVCIALLAGAALISAIVVPPLMSAFPLSASSLAAVRQQDPSTAVATAAPARLGDFVISLIPSNPVKAAADGALLPLVVFSVLTGVALISVSAERRHVAISFFRAIADTMIVIVRWMLLVAPIGVFALAVPLAARIGIAAAGALAYYIVAISITCILIIGIAIVVTLTLARMSPGLFFRSAMPALAVAFSSRSSLAALPALVEGAERARLPQPIGGFFLPLAVATFRMGAIPAMLVGSMFLGRLYGVDIPPVQVVAIVLTAALLSFSVPGIPGGGILVMAPVLANAGIPAAGIGILLALDTVPDMFRTMTNVTGDITAASILSRLDYGDADDRA